MERARLAEIIIAGFLFCFSVYFLLLLVRVTGFSVVLNMTLFLALVGAGILLIVDVFEERVLFTRIHAWARRTAFRLRVKYSVSPFTIGLGPLRIRVNDPISLIISLLFIIDVVAGVIVLSRSILLGIALNAWGLVLLALFIYKALFTPSLYIVDVKPREAGRIAKKLPWIVLLSRLRLFEKIYSTAVFQKLVDKIHGYSVKAGLDWPLKWTEIVLKGLINIGFVAGLAATPVLVILTGVYGLISLAAPVIVLAGLMVYLYARMCDRKRSIELELPFISLAALLSALGGLGLVDVLEKLSCSDFPGVSREYKRLKKFLSSMDPVTALNRLGREHPSGLFREFVLGYTSVILSGGDLHGYLLDRTREYFNLHGLSLRRYAGLVSSILGLAAALLVFVPIFILLSTLASPLATTDILLYQFNLLLPFIGFGMVSLLHGQVMFFNRYRDDVKGIVFGSVAAGVAAVACVLAGLGPSMIMGLTVLSAMIGYGLVYIVNRRVINSEERYARMFIRDLIELRKIGYPVPVAVKQLVSEKKYGPEFLEVLKDFLSDRITAQSYVVRAMLRILRIAEMSGADLPSHLEFINRFFSQYLLAREEMKASLREVGLMAYLAPPVLAFLIYTVIEWFKSFTGEETVFIMPRISGFMVEQARLTIIIVSLILGVIMAKGVDGTVRNTVRPAIMIILALISLLIAPEITAQIFPGI